MIHGAAEHPTALVESVAMGSISAPKPEAVPQLPDGLVPKGLLSAAQAETLIYAASAHARDLPGRFEPEDKGCSLKASAEGHVYRQGYFLGDGTGAGKGRQVASVILDRWVRGERRHIWISKNEALLEDARRDWAALGGLPIDIQPLSSWKLGTPIAMRDGILFVTYPTLRSGRNDATRLDQILAWAGEDFDGVIVFDEAHAIACWISAGRWVSSASRRCPPMTLSRPSWQMAGPWNWPAAKCSWSNAAWSMAHSDLNSPDGVLLGSTGTRRKAALPRSSAIRPGSSCRSKAQRA